MRGLSHHLRLILDLGACTSSRQSIQNATEIPRAQVWDVPLQAGYTPVPMAQPPPQVPAVLQSKMLPGPKSLSCK